MRDPRNEHRVTVIPSNNGWIGLVRNRNGAIQELHLVLVDQCHFHEATPRVIVVLIQERRGKNQSRNFVGMKIVWIGA